MSRLTPSEYQEKQARRLKGSIEDMRRGITNVTSSPTAAAAKKADKMRANIVASIDSGKWAAGLNRVTLDEWKSKMIDKGLNRVAAGIDAASDKVTAFATAFLPHLDKGQELIKKMPDLTLEDQINRMTTFIRHTAKFKR